MDDRVDDGVNDRVDDNNAALSRRQFLITSATAAAAMGVSIAHGARAADGPGIVAAPNPGLAPDSPHLAHVTLNVNGTPHTLDLDTRTTLLDALREHLQLTGTKKGCDHGQCGACTVLIGDRRVNACLTLAVMHQGDEITTIEGVGTPTQLHPLQAAFIKHDGYQCGYCTPGQICSAVGMLAEVGRGMPSHVSANLVEKPMLSPGELRERMSGNICRCGAYSNIAEAIAEVAEGQA